MIFPRAAADGLPPNPHGQGLAIVSIVMCIITGLLVVSRLLTRIFMVKAVGWDDHILVLSMTLAVCMCVCFNMEVYYGMGLRTEQMKNPQHKIRSLLWLWINQILYKIANGSIKISIALLYLRIFPSQRFKYIVWSFMGFVIAYCLGALLPSIFQCQPISKAWHKTLPGHCIDITNIWYVNSAMTLLADTILICLPVSNIIKSQLPKIQRFALVFVFSLGAFVMATTIVRLVSLSPLTTQGDLFWYQCNSNNWALIEIDVSIICASIPVLRAPAGKLFPRLLGKLSIRNRSSDPGQYYHDGIGGQALSGSAINMQNRSDWQRNHMHARGRCDGATDDAASDEEHILRPDGIRKTMEVTCAWVELDKARPDSHIRPQ